MIIYDDGDIFHVMVDAIVNPVCCDGESTSRLEKQFKEQYPANYIALKHARKNGELVVGKVFLKKISDIVQPNYIFNLPTRKSAADKCLLEDIDAGMAELVRTMNLLELRSIAIPAFGTNSGGLKWEDVRQVIAKHVWVVPLMKNEYTLMLPWKKI